MTPHEARSRFVATRVARLATSGPQGPHIVPITFAVEGDTIVTAIDAKPKRGGPVSRVPAAFDNRGRPAGSRDCRACPPQGRSPTHSARAGA